MYFEFTISLIYALKKDRTLHLNKLEFPFPITALCQAGLKLPPWFLRRFLSYLNVYFAIISLWKRGKGPLSEQPCISFTNGCLMQSLIEIALVVLKIWSRFSNFVNVFLLFHTCNYLPLEMGGTLHLNKLEWFCVPSLFTICPVVLEKNIFIFCQMNAFSLLCHHHPWAKNSHDIGIVHWP